MIVEIFDRSVSYIFKRSLISTLSSITLDPRWEFHGTWVSYHLPHLGPRRAFTPLWIVNIAHPEIINQNYSHSNKWCKLNINCCLVEANYSVETSCAILYWSDQLIYSIFFNWLQLRCLNFGLHQRRVTSTWHLLIVLSTISRWFLVTENLIAFSLSDRTNCQHLFFFRRDLLF